MRVDPNEYVELGLRHLEAPGDASEDDEEAQVDSDLIHELQTLVYERLAAWYQRVAPGIVAILGEDFLSPEELDDPMTHYFEEQLFSFSYNDTDYHYGASSRFAVHLVKMGVRAIGDELDREILASKGYRLAPLKPLARQLILGGSPFVFLRGWVHGLRKETLIGLPETLWPRFGLTKTPAPYLEASDKQHVIDDDLTPEEADSVAASMITGHCLCEACTSLRADLVGAAHNPPLTSTLPSLAQARDALIQAPEPLAAIVRATKSVGGWSKEDWDKIIGSAGPPDIQVVSDWLQAQSITLPWPALTGLVYQLATHWSTKRGSG
ncbi:MAG: hypothetical protein U0271_05095 [Polyangiaceae bacterium]